MHRWEILQYYIDRLEAKTYMEVGFYKSWCFSQIKCESRVAVDPNPSQTIEQENAPYGSIIELENNALLYKETSDDFFFELPENIKFKVIFLDGLHTHEQLYKDIQNSIKHLEEGGVIVLHDQLPPSYQHTTTGDEYGNWNGDCYKAFLQFRQEDHFGKYDCFTVATDWGCGVIKKSVIELENEITDIYQKGIDDWDFFDKNRKQLLNLISVEEFLKRENINQ